MNNNLMIFENNAVEVFEFEGKILFNPRHVGEILGMSEKTVMNSVSVMNDNKKVKMSNSLSTGVRKFANRGETFITESGVYDLIFKSRKPEAIRFKDWVTDEVLPTIRKTGGYIPTTPQMTEQEILSRALLIAQRTNEQKDTIIAKQSDQIAQQAPKVLFADSVASSNTSILVFDLAKLLKQNGVQIGGNRLFQWLRENGYLVKRKGSDYNMPTQKSMDLKLFEIKESTHTHADGHTTVNRTPKVTGKGQVYFISKFMMDKVKE